MKNILVTVIGAFFCLSQVKAMENKNLTANLPRFSIINKCPQTIKITIVELGLSPKSMVKKLVEQEIPAARSLGNQAFGSLGNQSFDFKNYSIDMDKNSSLLLDIDILASLMKYRYYLSGTFGCNFFIRVAKNKEGGITLNPQTDNGSGATELGYPTANNITQDGISLLEIIDTFNK
jgi:hypothetical protein